MFLPSTAAPWSRRAVLTEYSSSLEQEGCSYQVQQLPVAGGLFLPITAAPWSRRAVLTEYGSSMEQEGCSGLPVVARGSFR